MFGNRAIVQLGFIRGPFGIRSLGSIWIRSGSVWDPSGPGSFGIVWNPFGVRSGSVRDSFGIRLESIWNPFGIRLRSVPDTFGVHSESVWNPFRVRSQSF